MSSSSSSTSVPQRPHKKPRHDYAQEEDRISANEPSSSQPAQQTIAQATTLTSSIEMAQSRRRSSRKGRNDELLQLEQSIGAGPRSSRQSPRSSPPFTQQNLGKDRVANRSSSSKLHDCSDFSSVAANSVDAPEHVYHAGGSDNDLNSIVISKSENEETLSGDGEAQHDREGLDKDDDGDIPGDNADDGDYHDVDHEDDEEEEEEEDDEDEDDDDDDDEDDDDDDDDEGEDDQDDDGHPSSRRIGIGSFFGAGLSNASGGIFRNILEQLNSGDPTLQLIALGELANLLSISTEDSLAGYISIDGLVSPLVTIMRGPDAFGEDNPEMMLLACRCLANLMEALPASTANVAYGGAIPVLCQKLLEIQYIDLAEQALSTLEKISKDYPASVVREGGLNACLAYLDFFSTNVQRTAVNTAANCASSIPVDAFPSIRDAVPMLCTIVNGSDSKVVEAACLCLTRIIAAFRNMPERLEELFDQSLLANVVSLLSPLAQSGIIGDGTRTRLLHALGLSAAVSIRLALDMLCIDIVGVLYQLLTGLDKPADATSRKANGIVVLQSMVRMPREQVIEVLNLVSALLPTSTDEGSVDDRAVKFERDAKLAYHDFAWVMLPTLMDIHSSTVDASIRRSSLLSIIRLLTHLSAAFLVELVDDLPLASFVAGVLSAHDKSLATDGVRLARLLQMKARHIYTQRLVTEGCVARIESFDTLSEDEANAGLRANAAGFLLEHAENLRSLETVTDDSLGQLRNIATRIEGGELEAFDDLAKFVRRDISSHYLASSGVLICLSKVLKSPLGRATFSAAITADDLAVLTLKTQELLSRSENFEVRTADASSDDRELSNVLAKQIRLKLVADDSNDIPRPYQTLVVSIHAIATFKALDDYLRPRVAAGFGPVRSPKTGTPHVTGTPRSAASSGDPAVRTAETVTSALAQLMAADANLSDSIRNRLASAGLSASQLFAETDAQVGAQPDDETAAAVNVEFAVDDTAKTRSEMPSGISEPSRSTRTAGQRPALSPAPAGRSMSYAAAAQSAPQDWHLQFEVDGAVIAPETTIYGAVINSSAVADASTFGMPGTSLYLVKFRKAAGPAPDPRGLALAEIPLNGSIDSSVINPEMQPLFELLSSIHALRISESTATPDSLDLTDQFVNGKLTAKLNRQLEEPLIVASSALPRWAEELPRAYPFLFPFESRYLFLQSTSFGYSRSMSRWQQRQPKTGRGGDDARAFLGRLQRQKVRISRSRMLESAVKVMELYGSSPAMLEVEYFDEVGTGLGPTLEFYATVSRDFGRRKLHLWRDESQPHTKFEHVLATTGLFPRPLGPDTGRAAEHNKRVLALFQTLGTFLARALLDSRIVDIVLNVEFIRIAIDTLSKPSLASLARVDRSLAKSLSLLEGFAREAEKQSAGRSSEPIVIDGVSLADLGLDFTMPGFPEIELIPNGASEEVTQHNIGQYIENVLDVSLGRGIARQVAAFRDGFSSVFPFAALRAFTPHELVMLFGQAPEDWTEATLSEYIHADHGFTGSSPSIKNLIGVLASLDDVSRRQFLQFVTGSPRLPVGGFKNLTPQLTVVCKPHDHPLGPDDYLPSVMTCVNYLKLPDYSSEQVLRSKLMVAMREGGGSFHLS
ncbi:Ubiquitin fusion degradation protein 4 [Savitreella phatthalungensis]